MKSTKSFDFYVISDTFLKRKTNITRYMQLGTRSQWEEKRPDNFGEDDCVLCSPEKTPIIWKGKHFFICRNKYPYIGLTDHLMAVPYRHIAHTSELSDEELLDLKHVNFFIKDYYKQQHYFSFIRETIGGKSLNHIHYHYLPGILYADHLEVMLKEQGF